MFFLDPKIRSARSDRHQIISFLQMCSQPNHLTCPKVNELDRVLWRQTSNPAPIAHWHVHLPMESHGKIGATAPEAEPRTTGFETSQKKKKNVQISEKKTKGWLFWNIQSSEKKKTWGSFLESILSPKNSRVISDGLGFFLGSGDPPRFKLFPYPTHRRHGQTPGPASELVWSRATIALISATWDVVSIWLGHWISIWNGKEPQKNDGKVYPPGN